jgi:hypothetical protein
MPGELGAPLGFRGFVGSDAISLVRGFLYSNAVSLVRGLFTFRDSPPTRELLVVEFGLIS